MDTMSSEESGEDEDGGDEIIVRPIPWRSKEFTKVIKLLDDYIHTRRSSQSKRQMLKRILGTFTKRDRPDGLPKWA